ncbi:MAG: TolC family protein [Nitrospiraceae bacterium]|nr:TolC family protein [Nitrospiraceae bacterium]
MNRTCLKIASGRSPLAGLGSLHLKALSLAVCAVLAMLGFSINANAAMPAAPITNGTTLTLENCIGIALQRNPAELAAGSIAQAAKSRVGEAQSAYYPQLNWQTDYSRQSYSVPVGSAGRIGGAFEDISTGPALTQNIYDFGRTSSQVNIAKYNLESSRQDFETQTNSIILNVKTSYYGVLQAQKAAAAAEEVVKQNQLHLTQAQGFFKAGTKPKIDVTNAQVNLSNAQLSLIQAQNAVMIAWQNLDNAMGVPAAPQYSIVDNLVFKPYAITFDNALATAYKNRPDLKSVHAKTMSTEQALRFARAGYDPYISGSAGYTWSGDLFPMEHGWNVGASLTVPIFSGFLTKKQVHEAQANLDAAKANEENLRQIIYLQARQAYLNLKQAESSVPTAKEGLEQAKENLALANGRYAAGVGSQVDVTDALTSYSTAQTAYINALYNHMTAEANLENAMGVR